MSLDYLSWFSQLVFCLFSVYFLGTWHVSGAGESDGSSHDDDYGYYNDSSSEYDNYGSHAKTTYMVKTQPYYVVIPVGITMTGMLLGWIYFLYTLNNKPSEPRDDTWYMQRANSMVREENAERMGIIGSESH